MAADLGEAIGLQGRPNVPDARTMFWDTVKLGEAEKEKKRQAELARKKGDEDADKYIRDSIKIDYSKYHKTDIPLAYQATEQAIKRIMDAKASGNPAWKNEAPNLFNELNLNLAKLSQASKAKFDFEKYKQEGGFTDKDADNYYEYLKTNNPAYLKGIDLTRSSVISAIDPETGAAAFNPFKRRDLPAAIRQNVFTDKVERVGNNADGFTEMVSYYDPATVETKAATLFQDPEIRQNFEATVKGKIMDNLKNTLYKGSFDQYTINSPEFQNDYEQALLKEFVGYSKTLEPKTVNLSRNPKDNITNINIGGADSPEQALATAERIPVSYTDPGGFSKNSTAERGYAMEGQKILIPKGEYLKSVKDGSAPKKSGASEADISGIYVMPVYKSGFERKGYTDKNKRYSFGGTLVADSDKESVKGNFEYKPIVFVTIDGQTYYGDADKITGASRYLDAADKEKPFILKTAQSAQKDADELNRKLKTTTPKTSTVAPTSNKKKIQGF